MRLHSASLSRLPSTSEGRKAANLLHRVFTVRDGLIVRHAFSGEPEEIRRAAGVPSR
jgi:hypothetical protein